MTRLLRRRFLRRMPTAITAEESRALDLAQAPLSPAEAARVQGILDALHLRMPPMGPPAVARKLRAA